MAELAPVAADVLAAAGADTDSGTVSAAAGVTAGDVLYKDSNSKLDLADSDVAATDAVAGIALNDAAQDQPVNYVKAGGVDLGIVLTVGDIIVLSSTPGTMVASDDVLHTSGDYVSIIGVVTTASNLEIRINNSGALKP